MTEVDKMNDLLRTETRETKSIFFEEPVENVPVVNEDKINNSKEKFDAFMKAYDDLDVVKIVGKEDNKLPNAELSEKEASEQTNVGIADLVFLLNEKLTRKINFLKDNIQTINNPDLLLEVKQLEGTINELIKEKLGGIRSLQNVHRSLDSLVVDVFKALERNAETQEMTHDEMEYHESTAQDLYGYETGLRNTYGDDFLTLMSKEEMAEYIYLKSKLSGLPEEEVSLQVDSLIGLQNNSEDEVVESKAK